MRPQRDVLAPNGSGGSRLPGPYAFGARSTPPIAVLAPTLPIHDASHLNHPQLRQLYDLWQQLRGRRLFPARQDFDLSNLTFVLGNVMLIDVSGTAPRFRFRLVGTEIAKRFGTDMTGQWADEPTAGEYRLPLLAACRAVVDSRWPCAALRDDMPDQRACRFEMLLAPLSDDNATINMLIVAILPARSQPQADGAARFMPAAASDD